LPISLRLHSIHLPNHVVPMLTYAQFRFVIMEFPFYAKNTPPRQLKRERFKMPHCYAAAFTITIIINFTTTTNTTFAKKEQSLALPC
jgi:hypothetical protein